MPDYNRNEMRLVIDNYVINARYRDVLRLRYCEGLTHEQVAQETHYSTQHVKSLCKRYKEMLFSHL